MQLKKHYDFRTFTSEIVCNQENKSYLISICSECTRIEFITPQKTSTKIIRYQWENNKNGKVDKVQHNGGVVIVLKKFTQKRIPFKVYICEEHSSKDILRGKRKCKK